jgi:hypothetical protein
MEFLLLGSRNTAEQARIFYHQTSPLRPAFLMIFAVNDYTTILYLRSSFLISFELEL